MHLGQQPLHQCQCLARGRLGRTQLGIGLLLLSLATLQLAQLGLALRQLGFRIGVEGHPQVLGNELAEVMVGAAEFLLLEGQLGIAFGQLVPLGTEHLDALFAGRASEQRGLGIRGITQLPVAA